jgi:anthranilate phosphoribosyltransferase
MSQIQTFVERVTDGEDLTQTAAREAARLVFEEATEAQIGALLAGLRGKGETEAEIAGLAEGMRAAARTIDPGRTPLVDTCGTGGDDHDTINVSTTAAMVAAGAGVPVAKHGNYSVSSASGSADVLEAVGVDVEADPAAVEATIEREGVGFMLAPVFHPAMEAVIGPRRELGVRTVFNVLGPLTNPAGADAQVVGVYDPDLVPVLARALARMDVERALVVHGEGLDEIAVHGETRVAEVDGSAVETYTLAPADLGVEHHRIEAVAGGDPEANAADMRAVLRGDLDGAKRDIVVANAGAAVYVAGETDTIVAGVDHAREAIASGAAATALSSLTETVPASR